MNTSIKDKSGKWDTKSKAEFKNLSNFYKITKEVARGAYGVCYEGFLLNPETKEETSRKVAVKYFYRDVYPQLLLLEYYFLKLVEDTPNIVTLENFMVEDGHYFIVTEYYDNVNFEKIMRPEEPLSAPISDIKYYMYALLEGLDSLHDMGVVHRDIKQGNFLYNPETKKGILIDFGLAELSADMKRRVSKGQQDMLKQDIYEEIMKLQFLLGENKIGTQGFMPPEQVLKKNSQSYGVDMWSAGVVFLEFLTAKEGLFKGLRLKGQDPNKPELADYAVGFLCSLALIFGKQKVEEICQLCDFEVVLPEGIQEHQISWREIVKHSGFDGNCENLLDQMLRLNPDERISAKKALEHPFFAEIRGVPG